MSTQYLQFSSAPSQTCTPKLFALGGDVVLFTGSAVADSPSGSGLYKSAFSEASALNGTFRCVVFVGSIGVAGYEVKFTGTDTEVAQGSEFVNHGGGTACDPDVNRIFVNQDYGGKNNLTYVLSTIPVGQATIELFLYDDYMAGDRDATYRIGNSRQTDDGSWAVPFYLDPNTYILRFYRPQIAGPDAYRLVVSANPAEIVFERVGR